MGVLKGNIFQGRTDPLAKPTYSPASKVFAKSHISVLISQDANPIGNDVGM